MAKDYAKKSGAQAKRPSDGGNTKRGKWFVLGLLTGIAACVAVSTAPWSMVAERFSHVVQKQNTTAKPKVAKTNKQQPPKPQFDFYSMLPQMNEETDKTAEEPDQAVVQAQADITIPAQKSYIIQAASFIKATEAERMKAQLLLAGFDASIEIFVKDDKTWYRVMVGPFSDTNAARKQQQKLKNKHIDSLLLTQKV